MGTRGRSPYTRLMSAPARLTLDQLLRLPEDERADLAAALLASLDPGDASADGWDEEWLRELRARAATDDPGEPWPSVLQSSRGALRAR